MEHTIDSIKTIDVIGLSWFDKVNGNSYFAGWAIINFGMPDEIKFKMPFQYGYGDQYRQEAKNVIEQELGVDLPSYYELKERGIICRFTKHENCKKSELKNI